MRIQDNHNKKNPFAVSFNVSTQEMAESQNRKAKKGQGGVSLFAGDFLNKEPQSLMEQKKEQVREQAHKVLMDKFESDLKRDEVMGESRAKLEGAQAAMKAAHEQMKDAPEEIKEQLKEEMEEAQKTIVEESSNIRGMKQAKLGELYENSMAKAANVEHEILREGAKEIAGAGIKESMNHIEEMYQENIEKAKKAKEKKEEKEEILEERREEKVEKEKLLAEQKEERAETEELLQPKDGVQNEIQKMAEEAELLEEDLKGLMVDAQL